MSFRLALIALFTFVLSCTSTNLIPNTRTQNVELSQTENRDDHSDVILTKDWSFVIPQGWTIDQKNLSLPVQNELKRALVASNGNVKIVLMTTSWLTCAASFSYAIVRGLEDDPNTQILDVMKIILPSGEEAISTIYVQHEEIGIVQVTFVSGGVGYVIKAGGLKKDADKIGESVVTFIENFSMTRCDTNSCERGIAL